MRAQGDGALVARIREELHGGAFEVTEVEAGTRFDSGDLAAMARDRAADAALRVQQRPTEIELWTARPVGDPDGTFDVIREPGGTRHEQEVLVLRVVETLRALGLQPLAPAQGAAAPAAPEAASPTSEPASEAAPDAAAAREPTPTNQPEPETQPAAQPAPEPAPRVFRAPQLWLELAPALALSPGGFAPQLQAQLGVRYQPLSFLSVSGFALAPLWRAPVERADGSSDASTWLLGLAADSHHAAPPFELSVGLGIAAVLTPMSGSSASELERVDETERTAAPLARAALHVELGGSLRLQLRALVGASVPEVSMRFGEREVATWGRPFVIFGVGLELPVIEHPSAREP